MRDIWEPWIPSVGQRVRVLARPECLYCRGDDHIEVGTVGTVSEIDEPDSDDIGIRAHRFWVDFWIPDHDLDHYAACELEPVP